MVKLHDAATEKGEIHNCILQSLPARKLVDLIDVPTLVLTAEANYYITLSVCMLTHRGMHLIGLLHLLGGKKHMMTFTFERCLVRVSFKHEID